MSQLPVTFPLYGMQWALEVEITHVARMEEIILAMGKSYVTVKQPSKKNVSKMDKKTAALIYITENLLLDQYMPFECFKYVSRVFYVPNICDDICFICRHSSFRDLMFSDSGIEATAFSTLKIVAAPKELELYLINIVSEFNDAALRKSVLIGCNESRVPRRKMMLHPTAHSYILMSTYSPHESLFRWGIVSKEFSEAQLTTTEALAAALSKRRAGRLEYILEPASRAFYKLEEIVDHHLPSWRWRWPSKDSCVAVDVGASPGGWTQCLSSLCRRVIAVDPGELRADVRALQNVVHVRAPIQAACVRELLATAGEGSEREGHNHPADSSEFKTKRVDQNIGIRVVVCDINCEAHLAANLLRQHVLPFVEGFGYCCSEHRCVCLDQQTGSNSGGGGGSVSELIEEIVSDKGSRDLSACVGGDDAVCSSGVAFSSGCEQGELPLHSGLESAGPDRTAILVITLKLLKNPKQRHINQAVQTILQKLEPVQPCNRCCPPACANGRWKGAWDWCRPGSAAAGGPGGNRPLKSSHAAAAGAATAAAASPSSNSNSSSNRSGFTVISGEHGRGHLDSNTGPPLLRAGRAPDRWNSGRGRQDEASILLLGGDCRLVHLCANSMNERTLVLRRTCGTGRPHVVASP